MNECKICKSEIKEETAICKVCNYPLQGTDKEKASYVAKQVMQKSDVKESIKILKKSRMILFAIGAFYCIVPFIQLFETAISNIQIISLALGLIFIGFAFLTYKMPLIALAIPLSLVLIYYITLLLTNPMYLWSGIIWKLIILMGLGYGFISVIKANKILKENKYLASVLGFGEIRNK